MLSLTQTNDQTIVHPKLKWVAIVLALGTIIVLGAQMVHRAAFSTKLNSDFATYRSAGQAVLDGSDIYAVQNARGWSYVYPPPFAILMAPFAAMSPLIGSLIWFALSVFLVVSSLQMSVTMVRTSGWFDRNLFWLYVVTFVMVMLWVGQAAVEGQATILMLWLVMVALYRWQRERDLSSGAALACAGLLKAFPLTLLIYFAFKPRWRLLTGTVMALVVGGIVLPSLVYGWQRNLTYWEEWVGVIAHRSLGGEALNGQNKISERVFTPNNPRNQALRAVLWRLGMETRAGFLAIVIGSLMALLMVLVALRTTAQQDLPVVSAWLAWILVVTPLSHFHYQLFMLLPMTVLASLALIKNDSLLTTLARMTLVIYWLASGFTVAFPGLQYIGLLCWATLAVWAVLLLVGIRRLPAIPQ